MLVSGIARILLDSGIEQLSGGIAKLSGSPDLTPWKCYLLCYPYKCKQLALMASSAHSPFLIKLYLSDSCLLSPGYFHKYVT